MYSKTKLSVQLQNGLTRAFPTTVGLKQGKKLQTYCDKWKLKVSTTKIKTMKVDKRQSRQTSCKPILCKIILKIVRYWERIKESSSPILKAVLITNKQLQREGKPS